MFRRVAPYLEQNSLLVLLTLVWQSSFWMAAMQLLRPQTPALHSFCHTGAILHLPACRVFLLAPRIVIVQESTCLSSLCCYFIPHQPGIHSITNRTSSVSFTSCLLLSVHLSVCLTLYFMQLPAQLAPFWCFPAPLIWSLAKAPPRHSF